MTAPADLTVQLAEERDILPARYAGEEAVCAHQRDKRTLLLQAAKKRFPSALTVKGKVGLEAVRHAEEMDGMRTEDRFA